MRKLCPTKPSGTRRIALASLALAVALAIAPPALGQNQPQAKPPGVGGAAETNPGGIPKPRGGGVAVVALDKVTRGPIRETVPVYGRLVSRRMGDIAARVRGAVAEILVEVGDRVEAGSILARLVGDTLAAEKALKSAELEEYTAKVETAKSQLALASQELKRLRRLRRSAAFSQARYDDKRRDVERFRSALGEVRAKVKQAKAELRMADIALSYSEIHAPYSGVVSLRHTEIGAFLSVGDPVITLIDDTALEVEAEVPAVRISGLKPGTVLDARFEGGRQFEALVRAVVPQENALARTRTVRFAPRFGETVGTPAVNQSVLLAIPAGAPRVMVSVHKDAIVRRDGRTVVFAVSDGVAEQRLVRVGAAIGGRFTVIDGLAPGELVVIRGNERLRPGQRVRTRTRGGPS